MATILINGKPTADNFKPPIIPNHINVYEVVRAQNGVVLFAENHFARLAKSLEIANTKSTIGYDSWLALAQQVLMLNNATNINVRYDYYCINGTIQDVVVSTLPPSYPSEQQRKNGVPVCLFFAERQLPNAKITDAQVREAANQRIASTNSFEALLVNHNDAITEGSRSNFFAIIDNKLITAPDHLVLQGIMRQQVIKVIENNNLELSYRPIGADEVKTIEGAFLTGTSPRVLTINRIDNTPINHNHRLVKVLYTKIEQEVARYIVKHKA
jgi:branched-chain amino acid aminotransferase